MVFAAAVPELDTEAAAGRAIVSGFANVEMLSTAAFPNLPVILVGSRTGAVAVRVIVAGAGTFGVATAVAAVRMLVSDVSRAHNECS